MTPLAVLFPAFASLASVSPVTPGWENVCRERAEFPPVKVVWTASPERVSFELRDDAEGTVTVKNGSILISKTNSKGMIVVKAPEVPLEPGREVRLFADVSARASDPDRPQGFLCAYSDGEEKIAARNDIDARWFGGGGLYMRQLVNSAPGMTYRKYGHARTGRGKVTPLVVVAGAPSESEWRGWAAEDLEAAQSAWEKHWESMTAKDRSADMEPEDVFDRALAADIDHTAKIVTIDGTSRLTVDGKVTAPIVYKENCAFGPGRELFTYAGKGLNRAGIKLSVIAVNLASFPKYKGYWRDGHFDLQGLAAHVKNRLRAADGSCVILSVGCSAPPAFMDGHMDDVWRRKDGSVVLGDEGSAFAEYSSSGKVEKDRAVWPWPSYASERWRSAIKDKITAVFSELKRTGVSKRIVGVHFSGYHDAQFATPFEDHSRPAKDEYARYKSEGGTGDYAMFMRQIGFRAQEEFARHAKKTLGKDIIAVRWCMAPFGGGRESSFDLTAFTRSDAIDVVVPQPTYTQRQPALAQGPRLPTESFHLHGKMMWYEFDLRTWAALELWGQSAVAVKGLGQADDLAMWQTVFRKHAGIMLARRMGWWFYDMAGGWFVPPELTEDVKSVIRTAQDLQSVPPDPWRPSVAVVIDEEAMACYNSPGFPEVKNLRSMVLGQWPRLSSSGVPYDVWLAKDAMEDPAWPTRYKAAVLSGFLAPDGERKRFMETLASNGVAVHVTQSGGFSAGFFHDFVAKAGGYTATRPGVQVDMNGDFASVHCLVPGRYEFRLPFPCRMVNLKDGREEASSDGVLPLNLTAGETCWFRIYRK